MTRTKEDQLALEREMLTLGRDRVELIAHRQRLKGQQSLSKWGEHLSALGVEQLVPHLRAIRRRIAAGKAGPSFALLSPLTHLPPQQVAATAARTVVDCISSSHTLHHVAADVSDKLWTETMLDRATQRELGWYKQARGRGSHKQAVIRRMQATDEWTPKERMATGTFLVYMLAKYTGLIAIELDHSTKPCRRVVKPTKACMEWIEQVHNKQLLMTPNYLPLVIPPRPWTTPTNGGYYAKHLSTELLKSNAQVVAAHSDGSEAFMSAANRQQSVPWSVDGWMLEQIQLAYDQCMEVGCLLPREGWPVPPYPKHLPDDDPGVRAWRKQAKRIHEKNERTLCARINQAKMLWVARRFADEPCIYFTMSLDFRGRYFYRQPFLNPQGNEACRALLRFAEGVAITNEDEADWLRVHGANVYGMGKHDYRTRVDWVHENQHQIRQVGADPWLRPEFWLKADKPWQFLAFCRAYKEFSDVGFGYPCRLPVTLDCTCSGIQHYSGLLRSEDMGAMVNLVDNDQPQDIYGMVMARVLARLRDSDDPRAGKWLALQPDRSLAKPIVMTLPYSATPIAYYHACWAWALDRADDMLGPGAWPHKGGAMSAMHFMAQILHAEARALIGHAEQAMEYLRALGRAAGKEDVALRWVTPSGLLVQQMYPNTQDKRIRLRYLSDVRLDVRCKVDDLGLDQQRMARGLSPNVVHSQDASHMALVTNHAMSHGVRNLGGIHDCFVTTPAEMKQVRNSVRTTFADLYAASSFDTIVDQLLSQLSDKSKAKLPPRPALGDLDLTQVQTSNYFIT